MTKVITKTNYTVHAKLSSTNYKEKTGAKLDTKNSEKENTVNFG